MTTGPEPPETVIRPPAGWQLINFAELWHFRDLLYFLAWRDVKVRYKQTLLGVAWAVLQPAMMMLIFFLIFYVVARIYDKEKNDKLPYMLFVLTALLPWSFFATAIANAGNSVIGSERLISKIYFPRLAVPFATVGAAIVDFCVAMPLLAIMYIGYWLAGFDVAPGWSLLLAPVVFMLIVLSAAGVGTMLAALNVAYRDFRYIIPFMVQLWMYATPTIYVDLKPAEEGQEFGWVKQLLPLNPMTGLIASFRAALLDQDIPWRDLGFSAAMALVFFLVGCLYFRRVEDSFADVI